MNCSGCVNLEYEVEWPNAYFRCAVHDNIETRVIKLGEDIVLIEGCKDFKLKVPLKLDLVPDFEA